MKNKKKVKVLCLALLLLLPMAAPAATSTGWVSSRNDTMHNITAWIKREDHKQVRSFKIEAIMNSSIEMIGRLCVDMPTMPKWYGEVVEAKMLRQVSKTEFYYYLRFESPMGLPHRDGFFHAVISPYSATQKFMLLTVNAVPNYMSTKPGLERIAAYDYSIKLTPKGSNQIQLLWEGSLDIGSDIPEWRATFLQGKLPYQTILSMQRILLSKMTEHASLSESSSFTFVSP
jgi:hypothetical protein